MKEVDAATHRAKVAFPDKGGVLSPWLDVLVVSTRGDRAVGMPALEMQVACVLDEKDEAGAIVGALYSQADPPPTTSLDVRSMTFGDDGLVEYNRATHILTIELPDASEVHVTAPNGKVVVDVGADGQVLLAGDEDDVALAAKTKAEIEALRGAFNSHTHPSGAIVVAGVPATGITAPPAAPAPPVGDIAAAQVRSK